MSDQPSSVAEQLDLIELDQFTGFGDLSRKEQLFAEGIFAGLTQRRAAAHAGVTGSPEVLDQAGHAMMRNPRVQRVLAQAWAKSGADIHRTLAQAAHLQAIAYEQAVCADTAKARETAMKQWRDASALIASIHGKLSVRIDGQINHAHLHAAAVIPEAALGVLAQMRRDVQIARRDGDLPAPNSQPKPTIHVAA